MLEPDVKGGGLMGMPTSRLSHSQRRTRNSNIHLSGVAHLTRAALARCVASLFLLGAALALMGCAAVKVKLGMRVYLAKVQVTWMQAHLVNGPAIAPGEKSPLVGQFTQPDGKILVTEGQGKGKVLWQDLTVTPTLVTADQKGNLTLPRDPRVSDGKVAHVA